MPEVTVRYANTIELTPAPVSELDVPVLTLDQIEEWLGAHKCHVHELNVIQDLLAQEQPMKGGK